MGDEYISEMTQRAKGLNRVCCAWKPLEPKQYCEGVWLCCCTLLPLTGLATSSSTECQAESSSRFSGLVFKGLRIADGFLYHVVCVSYCCMPKPDVGSFSFQTKAATAPSQRAAILEASWGSSPPCRPWALLSQPQWLQSATVVVYTFLLSETSKGQWRLNTRTLLRIGTSWVPKNFSSLSFFLSHISLSISGPVCGGELWRFPFLRSCGLSALSLGSKLSLRCWLPPLLVSPPKGLESFGELFWPLQVQTMACASAGAICTGRKKGLLKTDGTHGFHTSAWNFHLTSLYPWTIQGCSLGSSA